MVGRRVKRISSKSNNIGTISNEQAEIPEEVPNIVSKQENVSSQSESNNGDPVEEEKTLNLSSEEGAKKSDYNNSKKDGNSTDTEQEGEEAEKVPGNNNEAVGNFKANRKFSSSSEGSSSGSRSPSPVKTHKKRHRSTSGSSSERDKSLQKNNSTPSEMTDKDITDSADNNDPENRCNSEETDQSKLKENQESRLADNEGSMEMNESPQEVGTKQMTEKDDVQKTKKIHTRKLSLSGSKESEKEDGSENKLPRKRKWGALTKVVPNTLPSISTESLKDLIPDYKPAPTTSSIENPHSEVLPVDEDPIAEEKEVHTYVHVASPKPSPKIHSSNVVHLPEVNKHKTIVHDEILPPSPPKNPPSCIIHVRNLVRPFTLHQLKEELAKSGTLVENGFWIDKIKSKCYVTYKTEEQASDARQALHGARWPVSNPKTLTVDFSTKEELEFHKKLGDAPVQKPDQSTETQKDLRHTNQEVHLVPEPRRPLEKEERSRKREREERNRDVPIREWDRDKLTQDMPVIDEKTKGRDRDRERDGVRPRERREKPEKKESKKKHEEETPAKLLDDLFRKTKTTPCIYWLPLTEEQREEAKKHREEEREKRRLRINQEEKENPEPDRRQRMRERDNRPIRDRDASRRSRSRSRSPGRRR